MARSGINSLSLAEKEGEGQPRRLLLNLDRAERWLVRAIRLWAQRRQMPAGAPGNAGRVEDWRVAFLASLEPAQSRLGHPIQRRVQVIDSALDDALADLNACLGILAAAPDKTWRFHHPGCLGLDGDEMLMLDFLRLAADGELTAAQTLLRSQLPAPCGPNRAERALRYLTQAVATLGEMGLTFPHRTGDEHSALH
ncbi:hypothetical protein [Dongia sp.]|uniref:hypothetical protein n=1 Tax=Dongia sp. TaxID=1977262 RepID=UPI0035B391F6